MDISETDSQIAPKLLVLLDDRQRQELEEVIISLIGHNESSAKYLYTNNNCIGIGSDTIGKLAVLDISENGRQIGEKLFALLNEQQKSVLVKHFCNTLFGKFTTCFVLQMVSSSCYTNAV